MTNAIVPFDQHLFRALDLGNGEHGLTVTIMDAGGEIAGVDDTTNTLQVISYEHHEIHAGSSYVASYAADVGNSGSINLAITTPNTTKYAHMLFNIISEAEAGFTLYEGAVITGGTAMAEQNRRRIGGGTAGCVVVHTPTVTNAGTAIFTKHWGTGKTTGAEYRDANEWILAPNLTYLFSANNFTTSDNWLSMWIDWYEHTDS